MKLFLRRVNFLSFYSGAAIFSIHRTMRMAEETKDGDMGVGFSVFGFLCCGVVVLWCCGIVVLWCCGVVVLGEGCNA
jgi:hypothetical protein